jgi:uncharacterized membrane protein
MQRLIKLIILSVLISICSTTVVSAKVNTPYAVTRVANHDHLNVRKWASSRSRIVMRLPHNTVNVKHLGGAIKRGQSIWWKIKVGRKVGWVNKRYLKVLNIVPQTPSQKKSTKNPWKPTPEVHKSKPWRPTTKQPPKHTGPVLNCGGSEPFWGLKISQYNLTFSPVGGKKFSLPVAFNKTSENDTSIAAIYSKASGKEVSATLQKVMSCSDGMSDIKYPFAITVLVNKQRFYSGCCNIK